jgi:uncharacterized membrane protein YvbJ
MAMVFCRGCGKELHETAPTCPQCGAPQGNLNSVIKDIKESLSKSTHKREYSPMQKQKSTKLLTVGILISVAVVFYYLAIYQAVK